MKSLSHRKGLLHIETPLGIVNITLGLHDRRGRAVESIEVIPNRYAGEQKVVRSGYANTRLIQLKRKA
jgi:hypothetical protein